MKVVLSFGLGVALAAGCSSENAERGGAGSPGYAQSSTQGQPQSGGSMSGSQPGSNDSGSANPDPNNTGSTGSMGPGSSGSTGSSGSSGDSNNQVPAGGSLSTDTGTGVGPGSPENGSVTGPGAAPADTAPSQAQQPNMGPECSKLQACYRQIADSLCDAGDKKCNDKFRTNMPTTESSCKRALSKVKSATKSYTKNKPDFVMPSDCMSTGGSQGQGTKNQSR